MPFSLGTIIGSCLGTDLVSTLFGPPALVQERYYKPKENPVAVVSFGQFVYEKTISEIQEKLASKIIAVQEETKTKVAAKTQKIQDRLKRILQTKQDYGIDDAAMADLFRQARQREIDRRQDVQKFTYMATVALSQTMLAANPEREQREVGVSIVESILTESDTIEKERRELQEFEKSVEEEVKSLQFVQRNLRPRTEEVLTYNDEGDVTYRAWRSVDTYTMREDQLRYLGF